LLTHAIQRLQAQILCLKPLQLLTLLFACKTDSMEAKDIDEPYKAFDITTKTKLWLIYLLWMHAPKNFDDEEQRRNDLFLRNKMLVGTINHLEHFRRSATGH
jgi:hypothetical protein